MREWAMRVILCVMACLLIGGLAVGAPAKDVSMADVAKIQVGLTTAEGVQALLGTPYSKTNYGDCNAVDYQEFWEYVGHDENGIFKIHIEFDDAHIARIVAKDPKKGPIVVLAAAPKPEHKHPQGSGQ